MRLRWSKSYWEQQDKALIQLIYLLTYMGVVFLWFSVPWVNLLLLCEQSLVQILLIEWLTDFKMCKLMPFHQKMSFFEKLFSC